MKKRKGLSVRGQLLCMSVIPIFIIGVVLTVISMVKLRSGMLEEAMDGLLASAKLFREELLTTSRDLTTNELEDEYKSVTGYDFTRFEGDIRASTSVVKSDGTRPVGTQAASSVIDAVLYKGQDFTDPDTEVAGMSYCVAYAPIKDEKGSVTGMAFAGKPTAEIEAQIRKSMIMVAGFALLIMIVSIILIMVIANRFVGVIKTVNDSMVSLSEGSFVKIDKYVDRRDELGDIVRSANSLSDTLMKIVDDIKDMSGRIGEDARALASTANQIKDVSTNVTTAVNEMAKGATEQADTIQTATMNIGSLSDAIQSVAENAEGLAGTASEMNQSSNTSVESLRKLSSNMEMMGKAMDEISKSITDTNQAVLDIGEKVDGITSISSQTNLLALNASIEAARAGESGRGFAVVAEEIGKLASDSAQMADGIRDVMKILEKNSHTAISKSEEVREVSDNVSKVLKDTVEIINSLVAGVSSTVDGVDNISGLTEECAANKTVIVDAMSGLSAISQENAASTEETAASMEQLGVSVGELADAANLLDTITMQLNDDLSFFK